MQAQFLNQKSGFKVSIFTFFSSNFRPFKLPLQNIKNSIKIFHHFFPSTHQHSCLLSLKLRRFCDKFKSESHFRGLWKVQTVKTRADELFFFAASCRLLKGFSAAMPRCLGVNLSKRSGKESGNIMPKQTTQHLELHFGIKDRLGAFSWRYFFVYRFTVANRHWVKPDERLKRHFIGPPTRASAAPVCDRAHNNINNISRP